MARNEEKHFCRLNRLLLQQEKEEQGRKNPKRPRLDTLVSADEIKQWIPSIKKDIEFCLAQSQVPCYPESKIADFQSNIQKLEQEFKAFVRKTKKLEPDTDGIPWTNRPYKSQKKENCENVKVTECLEKKEAFVPIKTPILDGMLPLTSHGRISEGSVVHEELITNDKPLTFCIEKFSDCYRVQKCDNNCRERYDQNEQREKCEGNEEEEQIKEPNGDLYEKVYISEGKKRNVLGLDYSSSDSET